MHQGTVVIPTWRGHFNEASGLVHSIRTYDSAMPIVLVIGTEEKALFEPLAQQTNCTLLFIDQLVESYTGKAMSASHLLKIIGKFRYQAIKKLLAAAAIETEMALVLDSESQICAPLKNLFQAGIEGTTVLYTQRPWPEMDRSLTTRVHKEVSYLIGYQPNWYFESYNWVYSRAITSELLQHLKKKHGVGWLFRTEPLFECQLYYQYAQQQQSGYRFMSVETLLELHFSAERTSMIVHACQNSPFHACGIIEYLAAVLPRRDYIAFMSRPEILEHLRLVRHEPLLLHDMVNEFRDAVSPSAPFFGEVSMHRGQFIRGKIAVLMTGVFQNEQDVWNAKRLLEGIECDLFIAVPAGHWTQGLIEDVLQPRALVTIDEESLHGDRAIAVAQASLAEKETKPNRDIISMSMFDKIQAAFNAMCAHEDACAQPYAVVVRIRPDILSQQRLRDLFIFVSEQVGALTNRIFFPDRFWSQGINDQLFFGGRTEMGRLLASISGSAYSQCAYLNPEWFLADTLRTCKLDPFAVHFEYILARGNYPSLSHISDKFNEQNRLFWSRTIPLSLARNLSKPLDSIVDTVYAKNGVLKTYRIHTSRGEYEFLFLRGDNARIYACVSEYKSPYIFAVQIPRWLISIFTYMALLGFPGVLRSANAASLRMAGEPNMVDSQTNRCEIFFLNRQQPAILATPTAYRPSWLLWFCSIVIRLARGVKRRTYTSVQRGTHFLVRAVPYGVRVLKSLPHRVLS